MFHMLKIDFFQRKNLTAVDSSASDSISYNFTLNPVKKKLKKKVNKQIRNVREKFF